MKENREHQSFILEGQPTPEPIPSGYRHLLRRALVGATRREFETFRHYTREQIIETLLAPDSFLLSKPLKNYNAVNCLMPDAEIAYGESWVGNKNRDPEVNKKRLESLNNWLIGSIFCHTNSITPRLILFWHDYFPIHYQFLPSAEEGFTYFEILRNNCLVNYHDLVSEVFLNSPFLNGLKNRNLFKNMDGPQFTRQVVSQFLYGADCRPYIQRERLSRFSMLLNHWLIHPDKRSEDQLLELKNEIRHIVQHEEAVQLLTKRLFRNFIYHQTDSDQARNTLSGLNSHWHETEGNIKSLIRHLLLSDTFQDPIYQGVLVRSPIDFLFTAIRQLHLVGRDEDTTGIQYYDLWNWIGKKLQIVGHKPGYPPEMTGWPYFIRHPFQQHWSILSMQYERAATLQELFNDGICIDWVVRKPDWRTELADNLPERFEDFILELSTNLLPHPIPNELIPELSQYLFLRYQLDPKKWKYLVRNPFDKSNFSVLETFLAETVRFLTSIPEYQLH